MKDLFKECFDERVPATEFKKIFCARCRNPTCMHAGWGEDKFGQRVHTQEERLFNPTFADPDNPKYASLQKQGFPSLFQEAIRLERADAIGDWSLPEDNVVLAPIEPQPATDESRDLVEEAVKSLRREGSKDQSDQDEIQETASEGAEAESLGSTVPASDDDDETPETLAAQILTTESKKNAVEVQTPAETPHRTTQHTDVKNALFDDGQMLDGSLPCQEIDEAKSKKQRVLDSWGSSGKVHEPGTTVKMGDDK